MDRSVDAERAALLAGVELFAGLDRVALAKLAAHLKPVALANREILFREGGPGDAFYLVAKGYVGVYIADPDGQDDRLLAVLGPGDPLGEMALLTNNPRAATIRAEADTELLRLDRSLFLRLVREEPGVALAIAATLSRRLGSGTIESAVSAAVPSQDRPEVRTVLPPEPSPSQFGAAVLGVALSALILVIGWFMASPPGLSAAGWHAIVIVLAMVPSLAVGVLSEGVLALLMIALWVLCEVTSAPVALAGFASANWVLVVGVLATGAAIAGTGLFYRIALWTVLRGGSGFVRHVVALCLGAVLVGPAVPNATSRVALAAPVVSELVEALGYAPRSRPAAGLAMAVLVGFGQMGAVFLTSSTTALLVFAILQGQGGVELSWLGWAYYAAPTSLLLLAGLIGAILLLYRPRADERTGEAGESTALALQRAVLGPPSRREKIAFAVGAAMLAGFVTQPLHGVHPAWVSVMALAVLATTGLVTSDTLRSVNWNFALLFGALSGIAAVFGATRVDEWLSLVVARAIGDLPAEPVLFVGSVALLCFAVSLVLRRQATAPLVTIAIGPVAASAGIDPFVVGLVAVIASACFFLPYQSSTYLAMYHGTNERVFTHAQALPAAIAYALVALVAVCASVPLWRAMGLL